MGKAAETNYEANRCPHMSDAKKTPEEYDQLKSLLTQDFFLIPQSTVYKLIGGFIAAAIAIFGIGYSSIVPAIKSAAEKSTKTVDENVKKIDDSLKSLKIVEGELKAKQEQLNLVIGEVKQMNVDLGTLPKRVTALEMGDYTPWVGPKGVIALNTKAQVKNPLPGIPKEAHQILMKVYIFTGNVGSEVANGADRELVLTVPRAGGAEYRYPLSLRTNQQNAIAYYTQILWMPAPKDEAFYTQFSSPLVRDFHANATFAVIGYK